MFRRRLGRVVLAVVALVGAGAWASAQVYQSEPIDPPLVLSGPDVGFRLESRRGEAIYGKVVVRVDGQWIEVNVSGPGPLRRLGSN
jgi:hypothetical protein